MWRREIPSVGWTCWCLAVVDDDGRCCRTRTRSRIGRRLEAPHALGTLFVRLLHHKASVLFSAFFHSGECIW